MPLKGTVLFLALWLASPVVARAEGPIQADIPMPGKAELATRVGSAPNCVFCKIIAGREPAKVLYQDDKVIAFVDHRSTAKKPHFLVIPKEHVPSLAHSSRTVKDQQLIGHMMQVGAQLAATHPKLARMRKGYQTHTNIGGGKGGTGIASVPHLHAHFTMPYKARVNPFKLVAAKAKRAWHRLTRRASVR